MLGTGRAASRCHRMPSSDARIAPPPDPGFHIDPYHGAEAAELMADFFEKCSTVRAWCPGVCVQSGWAGCRDGCGSSTERFCTDRCWRWATHRRETRPCRRASPPSSCAAGPGPLDQDQRGGHGAHLLAVSVWGGGDPVEESPSSLLFREGCVLRAVLPLAQPWPGRACWRALVSTVHCHPSSPLFSLPACLPAATRGPSTPPAWSRSPTSTPSGGPGRGGGPAALCLCCACAVLCLLGCAAAPLLPLTPSSSLSQEARHLDGEPRDQALPG